MAIEYKLPFTAPEIDAKLKSIGSLSSKIDEIQKQINSGSGSSGVNSWNDLQDKPFEELEPEINITWDGEIGDRFAMDLTSLGAENAWLVKVSDAVPTIDNLIGSVLTDSDGYDYIIDYDYIDTTYMPGVIIALSTFIVYSASELNAALGLPDGYITNGTYFSF